MKVEIKEVKTETIILTVNREEAEYITTLVGSIIGLGKGRKVCDKIYNSLTAAGISFDKHDVKNYIEGFRED